LIEDPQFNGGEQHFRPAESLDEIENGLWIGRGKRERRRG
jgi:hypothetical protein